VLRCQIWCSTDIISIRYLVIYIRFPSLGLLLLTPKLLSDMLAKQSHHYVTLILPPPFFDIVRLGKYSSEDPLILLGVD
jgi:hypothetical protein